MRPRQRSAVETFFKNGLGKLHHGKCRGADAEAHAISRSIDPEIKIVTHPPENTTYVAEECVGDEERDPLPYLERNKAIVDECEVLVAAPEQNHEIVRSGTWSTVRYARKQGKPVVIILPLGATKKIG
jgi:hypothetical protein